MFSFSKNVLCYRFYQALYSGIFFSLLTISCSHQEFKADQYTTSTLAFGSCLRQWQAQPFWKGITSLQPEAFIFLGDNVYTDVGDYLHQKEPQRIQQAYQDLSASTEYQQFLRSAKNNNTSIYAVWDDHDYGKNDAGADYNFKLTSKKYFLQFFGITKTHIEQDQAGIYQSKILDLNGVRTQLLLLDTRSFRSSLKQNATTAACPKVNNGANTDPDATVLGELQWRWLETQLLKPADVRILVTSIQLLATEHCYEKWANFPNERNRLFALLKKTRANGVIALSGDRHLAEIAVLPASVIGYPLYEITSSGLNSAMGKHSQGKTERNRFRVTNNNVLVNNFGSIQINRHDSGTKLKLQIRDENGQVLQQKAVLLDLLSH